MGESGIESALARAVAERGRASHPSQARVRLLIRAAGVAGLLVLLLGVTVIIGWVLDVPALTRIAPGLVTMKPSTAACLTALGAAVAASASAQLTGSRGGARAAVALVVPVIVVALLALTEDVLGVTLPTDNPFGLDPGDASTPVAGRMAQMTAVSLATLSTAVVLSARRRARGAQALALAAAAIGMTALVGYAYGVQGLYGVGPFNTIAVHSAAGVVLAAFGVLFLRPTEGYLGVFVGNTAGGAIVRRVLPFAVIAPYVVGAVVVVGLRHEVYDGPVALAIAVTVIVISGTALVWFQGEHLRDVDLRRGGAEDALRIAEQALAERNRVQGELAASLRRTRRILATAADAYIAVDNQGRVTDWNAAASEVFGWTRAEAVGENLGNLIVPPGDVADYQAGIVGFLRSGEAPILGQQVEVEAVNRHGTRLPVELTVWAEQEGPAHGFHAFVRDITARKRAEQDLRQLNADLKEFAAIAAHDLRSPLTTIQMQVDLVLAELDGGWDREETRAWIERIGRTADRGVELIDDLLAYASIGREAHVPRPVDLDALAREVADAQVNAAGRPATCTVAALPVVPGDEALLRQLVANLVANGIKYVPGDRTPQVVVDALTQAGERRCVLRVTDNGEGFAVDERERVFDMFQRGRSSTGVRGTGLGLAICRRVAELHGGRIWIDPEPSEGTRVCVELPLWSGAAPGAAPDAGPDPAVRPDVGPDTGSAARAEPQG